MGILLTSAWFSPLGWFSVWHPDLPWGSVRTLSWFSLPVSLLLLLSPLKKISSYRNPPDYKAGVFKGSVLITLLSESIPSPQDRNHTLIDPIPIPLAWPPSWAHVSHCCGHLGIPQHHFTKRTQRLLSLASNLLLILSYWCQELCPSKSHCQELKRHPGFPFAYLDVQVSEFYLFSAECLTPPHPHCRCLRLGLTDFTPKGKWSSNDIPASIFRLSPIYLSKRQTPLWHLFIL